MSIEQLQKTVGALAHNPRLRLKASRKRPTLRRWQRTEPPKSAEQWPTWVGVDLDGTLAVSHGFKGLGVIGKPVKRMMRRVKRMLREGKDVRIFTARAASGLRAVRVVEEWCEEHVGRRLPVTCRKDPGMKKLIDDRAEAIKKNTGLRKAVAVAGRPGVSLMPSRRNPRVRRWQRTTDTEPPRRGGGWLFDVEGEPEPEPSTVNVASDALLRLRLVNDGYVEVNTIRLTRPEDAAELMRAISDADREKVWVACLDADGLVLNVNIVAIGTLQEAQVTPLNVLKPALLTPGAASVALFHNHPSGSAEPSKEDMEVTLQASRAAQLVGLEFAGHYVIADDGWAQAPEGYRPLQGKPVVNAWGDKNPATDTIPKVDIKESPPTGPFAGIKLDFKTGGAGELAKRLHLGDPNNDSNYAVYISADVAVNGVEGLPYADKAAWTGRLFTGAMKTNSNRVSVWRRGVPPPDVVRANQGAANALRALGVVVYGVTYLDSGGKMEIHALAKSMLARASALQLAPSKKSLGVRFLAQKIFAT